MEKQEEQEKRIIGFSTACLYKTALSMDEKITACNLFYDCNAIELMFNMPEFLLNYNPLSNSVSIFNNLEFLTIHAPYKNIMYFGKSERDILMTKKIIEKLEWWFKEFDIRHIVFHPDIVFDFDKLADTGFPIVLENMDPRKKFGILPCDFNKLVKNHKFGFILDTEHAQEVEAEIAGGGIIIGFKLVWGHKLKYLHVSGQNSKQRHIMIHHLEQRQIVEYLKQFNQPIILEGVVEGQFLAEIAQEMGTEISFLKNNL